MKKTPYTIITILFAISTALWLLSKGSLGYLYDNPMKSITEFTAIIGATGYLINYLLSSRLPILEKASLPLDKAYKLHRIVGTFALTGVVLHVSSLLATMLPSTAGIQLYLLPGPILSYDVGIFAFYTSLLMVLTTFYIKMSYHIWRFIHVLTGFTLPLIVLHFLLIPSDISQVNYLQAWFMTLTVFAAVGWLYKLFVYPLVAYNHVYTITDVYKDSGVTTITMQASVNPLRASVGQFAFFKFYANGKGISNESHPFSILDCTNSSVTIAIKHLGDFTYRIQQIEPGDTVRVAGPYGGFGRDFLLTEKPAVWVAGGIGVVPFVNMLNDMHIYGKTRDVKFFYSTRENDTQFTRRISELQQGTNVSFQYSNSSVRGRVSPDQCVSTLEQAPFRYEYFLCGPQQMITDWLQYLKKIGISDNAIHLEDFNFKDLVA